MDVVESCSAGAGSTDTAIGLFATTVADAGSDESAHQFSLVACILDHTHDLGVGVRGDGVGMTDKANLVFVLDNAASFDSVLEEVPVGLFKWQERDVICYLLGYSQNSAVSSFRGGQV